MKNIDYPILGKKLEQMIMDDLFQNLEYWHDQADMRALALSDAGDQVRVVHYLHDGDLQGSYDAVRKMDTSPREITHAMIEIIAGCDIFQGI